MNEPSIEQLQSLWSVVKNFVEKNRISGSETINQCDHVVENSYEFIEQCCDVVGYYEEV